MKKEGASTPPPPPPSFSSSRSSSDDDDSSFSSSPPLSVPGGGSRRRSAPSDDGAGGLARSSERFAATTNDDGPSSDADAFFETDGRPPPPEPSSSSPLVQSPSQQQNQASIDSERQILLLMLLAQVCSLHDATPRTFTVHVLSLFERGILDRESIRFLFDLGLVPGGVAGAGAGLEGLPPGSPRGGDVGGTTTMGDGGGGEEGAVVPYRGGPIAAVAGTSVSTSSRETSDRQGFADAGEKKGKDRRVVTGVNVTVNVERREHHRRSRGLGSRDEASDDETDAFPDSDDGRNNVNRTDRRHHRQEEESTELVPRSPTEAADEPRRRRVPALRSAPGGGGGHRSSALEARAIRERLERQHSAPPASPRSVGGEGEEEEEGSDRPASAAATPVYPADRPPPLPPSPAVPAAASRTSSWAVEDHPLSLSRYNREFREVELLNSGSFGSVYRSTNKLDGRDYAVKIVAFRSEGYSNAEVQTVVREVKCLAQCDHANVVRYYTSWLEPSWMTGGGASVAGPDQLPGVGRDVRRRLLNDLHRMVVEGPEEEEEEGAVGGGVGGLAPSSRGFGSLLPSREAPPPTGASAWSFERGSGSGAGGASTAEWDRTDSRRTASRYAIDESRDNDVDHDDVDDSDSDVSEWSIDGGGRGDDGGNGGGKFWGRHLGGRWEESDASEWSIDGGERDHGDGGDAAAAPPDDDFSSRRGGRFDVRHLDRSSLPRGRQRKTAGSATATYKYQICLFIQMQLCLPSTLADWIRRRNATVRAERSRRNRKSSSSSADDGDDENDDDDEERLRLARPAFEIFRQIVRGLAHVHNKGILHRDLKPANVFASEDGTFKIGDFGLSKLLRAANGGKDFEPGGGGGRGGGAAYPPARPPTPPRLGPSLMLTERGFDDHDGDDVDGDWAADPHHTAGIGTVSYAAPEQIESNDYGPEADVYSLGLILLELFCDFSTEHERIDAFRDCRSGKLPVRMVRTYPEVARLVSACTRADPAERPTSEEIARSSLFRETNGGAAEIYRAELSALRAEVRRKDRMLASRNADVEERDRTIEELRRRLRDAGVATTTVDGTTGPGRRTAQSERDGSVEKIPRDDDDDAADCIGVTDSSFGEDDEEEDEDDY